MTLGVILVAVGALAFRVPQLGLRPMHADEAVQATRFQQSWHGSGYRYDPHEFHGPTLTYFTWPSIWITKPATFAETTAITYRIVPAVFGAALVLVLGWLIDGIGRAAAVSAALLIAISPVMVFYSRYYIHETLLVFFSLAAFATAWRYVRTGSLTWCVATGVCIGLMQATKETSVLSYAAAGLALCVVLWILRQPKPLKTARPRADVQPPLDHCESDHETSNSGAEHNLIRYRPKHLAVATAMGILVPVLLFTSFGDNPRGPWDAIVTYLPWLTRAGGASPHIQPWSFYFHRWLAFQVADGPLWSESLIPLLAGLAILVVLFWPQRLPSDTSVHLVRWLTVYTIALTTIYTCIPYKTPWCMLQFVIGWILLAGVGASILLSRIRPILWRAVVIAGLLISTCHLGWQAYRASYELAADPRNPYVYAQTQNDIDRLSTDVHELALARESLRDLDIAIIWNGPYYWPLPWYLREYENVGYWPEIPTSAVDASVVISSAELDVPLTRAIEETHLMTGYYAIRPGTLAQLWVRLDVWMAHLRRMGRLPAEE